MESQEEMLGILFNLSKRVVVQYTSRSPQRAEPPHQNVHYKKKTSLIPLHPCFYTSSPLTKCGAHSLTIGY